jgi:hypothetical protein
VIRRSSICIERSYETNLSASRFNLKSGSRGVKLFKLVGIDIRRSRYGPTIASCALMARLKAHYSAVTQPPLALVNRATAKPTTERSGWPLFGRWPGRKLSARPWGRGRVPGTHHQRGGRFAYRCAFGRRERLACEKLGEHLRLVAILPTIQRVPVIGVAARADGRVMAATLV